jgi:hypothetical protein
MNNKSTFAKKLSKTGEKDAQNTLPTSFLKFQSTDALKQDLNAYYEKREVLSLIFEYADVDEAVHKFP